MKTFSFSYTDSEGDGVEYPSFEEISQTVEFDDNTTWCAVLKAFIKFLSNAWGHDISDKVEYSTLQDKLQKLRDDGILWDDEEDWDLTKG
jgi:hypothetical protein